MLLAGAVFAVGVAIGLVLRPSLDSPTGVQTKAPALHTARPLPVSGAAHPAEVLRVLDGDTFEARVRVWPGMDITTKIRLRGIDAPEMKARCGEEREKADAARAALARILAQGDVGVSQVGLDKYGGRVLATAATRQTPDVSAAMLELGLARSYRGGHRDGWCN